MKSILITGAASGIGAAIASRFAIDGARLVLVDNDGDRLSAVVENTRLGPDRVHAACFDVADEGAWKALETVIIDRYGGLEFAVANAGISAAGSIAETDLDAWRTVMAVNLDGTFLTLRTAFRLIRQKGEGGSIVAMSSASAIKAQPNTTAYSASKAAIVQLVKVAALEGAPDRIRVNAILPAGVETPMWSKMAFFEELVVEHGSERGAFDALAAMGTPLKAYAKPEQIAEMVVFLTSATASAVTGASLVVDGGYTL